MCLVTWFLAELNHVHIGLHSVLWLAFVPFFLICSLIIVTWWIIFILLFQKPLDFHLDQEYSINSLTLCVAYLLMFLLVLYYNIRRDYIRDYIESLRYC